MEWQRDKLTTPHPRGTPRLGASVAPQHSFASAVRSSVCGYSLTELSLNGLKLQALC